LTESRFRSLPILVAIIHRHPMSPFSQRIVLVVFLLVSTASQADTSPANAPSIGGSLVQLLLGFAFVLALIFASLWVLKKLSSPRGQAAGLLKVIAATAVGPRERVVVVEMGENWLVLGVAPGRVTALHQLPRAATPLPQPGPPSDFAVWLKKTIERRNAS
jgi:flagellar protein FliO/FliZ